MYSIPGVSESRKNPFFQCTPIIAVSIVQAIKKAPRRVNSPSKIRMPPINSESAAAPIHNQAGRINGNGAVLEANARRPGPPNEPRTFPAPWAMKITPIDNRSGTVAHEAEVEASLRSILIAFRTLVVWIASNINLFNAEA